MRKITIQLTFAGGFTLISLAMLSGMIGKAMRQPDYYSYNYIAIGYLPEHD